MKKSHADDRAISAACLKLLRDSSVCTYAWLARGEAACTNYYIIRSNSGDPYAVHPSWSDAPWPVHLLLGTFSRKHIFDDVRKYNEKAALSATSQLFRRLRWAWKFRDGGERAPLPQLYRRPVKPCRGAEHPAVEDLCFQVAELVNDKVRALNRRLSRPSCRPQLPFFVKYGLKWLKMNEFSVDLADKDGTFVVYKTDLKSQMVRKQLSATSYRPVAWTTVEVDVGIARPVGHRLCRRLEHLGYPHWSHEASSRIDTLSVEKFVNPLNCTVKTHKPRGKLAVRLLHNS